MEHVFISYSRKDEEFVNLLVEELRHNHHDVWWDRTDIPGGIDWAAEIEKAVDNSYAVILVSSAHSKKSEWVGKELELAKTRKKTKQIPIIPLRVDNERISRSIDSKQAIDFRKMFDGNHVETIRHYRTSIIKLLNSLEGARPMLRFLKQLRDSNGDKREEAARLLGEIGDVGAMEGLIFALKDLDEDVRYEAALSLGKLKARSAFKPLNRLMMEDEEPDVCAAAATALGHLGIMEAIGPLEIKLKDPDMFVRASAARALGNLKNVSAVNMLVELLRTDGISDVREAAREALEKIGGRLAERALRRVNEYQMKSNEAIDKKSKKDEKVK